MKEKTSAISCQGPYHYGASTRYPLNVHLKLALPVTPLARSPLNVTDEPVSAYSRTIWPTLDVLAGVPEAHPMAELPGAANGGVTLRA
jgi:hypothetical protein